MTSGADDQTKKCNFEKLKIRTSELQNFAIFKNYEILKYEYKKS